MPLNIRELTFEDYDAVRALWEAVDGVGLSDGDSREGIARVLLRNPGLSWVAEVDGCLVGAVISGHDGRRAMIYHLAVLPQHQRQGIATRLLEAVFENLCRDGIEQCYAMAFVDNDAAHAFWRAMRAVERSDLRLFRCPVRTAVR